MTYDNYNAVAFAAENVNVELKYAEADPIVVEFKRLQAAHRKLNRRARAAALRLYRKCLGHRVHHVHGGSVYQAYEGMMRRAYADYRSWGGRLTREQLENTL